jgi:hypothetical protein
MNKITSFEKIGELIKKEYSKLNPQYGDRLNFSVERHPVAYDKYQACLKDGQIKLYVDPTPLTKDNNGNVREKYTKENHEMMTRYFSLSLNKDKRIEKALVQAWENCPDLSVNKAIERKISYNREISF